MTTAPPVGGETTNSVVLIGRVSAPPERRELPSGDVLVTLRLVVDRPPRRGSPTGPKDGPGRRRQVDVIDVACWTRRVQRSAESLAPDDRVRVDGSLRRRFFASGPARTSRYEVEATRIGRVTVAP